MFDATVEFTGNAGTSTIQSQEKDNFNLSRREKLWAIYDSTYSEYFARSFQDIIPPGGLGKYLNRLSQENNRKLQALDIAGQGKALLDLKKYGVGTVAAGGGARPYSAINVG